MTQFIPADQAEVAAAVAEAAAKRTPLSIRGLGTKAELGRPQKNPGLLDLSRLNGISFYEPEELVISALAGTPIETIETLLAQSGQELAFEPMSVSALYGTGHGTIGGCVMANLSGPRRIKAGAVRDFVLGVKAVSGRGEAFKTGGRVVKNVTGYDLSRGLCGSFGTLAAATEITLKVLPRGETSATLVLFGLDPEAATKALCATMGAPADVSGAAHLPPFAAATRGFDKAITAMRVEGFAPSVEGRLALLETLLKGFAPLARLDAPATESLWHAIRDVAPLAEPRERIIWRVSVAPTAGPKVAAAVRRAHHAEALFDWSGGLVWLGIDPCSDGAAASIREAVSQNGGGHATLVRGHTELRTKLPVFEPQPEGLAALSRRLKEAFDPYAILEPRRLWQEF
jgi:glycolate oxidase FAD binding subunit